MIEKDTKKLLLNILKRHDKGEDLEDIILDLITKITRERVLVKYKCSECGKKEYKINGCSDKSGNWYCSSSCKAKNLPSGPR